LLGGAVVVLVPALDTHLSAIAQAAIALGAVATLAFPISIGVGVLKYRLYDIDRIISRTVAYAIVTGLLVGVYAGLVLLATQVLTIEPPCYTKRRRIVLAALHLGVQPVREAAVQRRIPGRHQHLPRLPPALVARRLRNRRPGHRQGRETGE